MLPRMNASKRTPFQLVSHQEFARLSRKEKIAYLAKAIEAVQQNTPMLSPPDADTQRHSGIRYSVIANTR
jgi:hypothetical protein